METWLKSIQYLRANGLPFQSTIYRPQDSRLLLEINAPGELSRSKEKGMDDGLVLNIATDAPVLAKHISSKKSGRWTDR